MTLEQLEDRQAIVDLLISYATALDTRDFDGLGDVYLADAVAIYDGHRCEGLDAIKDICKAALVPLTASQHFLGNFHVELDGDRARSETYLHAQHFRAGARGRSTYVMAGTYRDQLIRTEGGWRIEYRELEITWTDGNAALVPA
jgi:3-phenylpropionate/cinnamic acid dioxygenase small subunit